MEPEAIAPYSPTTIYGQLTSPFTPKQITINAHTPYDKIDEEEQSRVFSREYFQGRPQARLVYELPDDNVPSFGVKYEYQTENKNNTYSAGSEEAGKQPAVKPELTSFAASQVSSGDIVYSSLKQGYTPAEAIAIRDAQNAYKNSAVLTDDPVGALSSRSYRVF